MNQSPTESTLRADVTIDPRHRLGEISPWIYGQYLEHVADPCIYPGVSDPESSRADADGLRSDVIAASTELGVPFIRWPGGCFADVYHWEDGIGPASQRPVRRNWHWGGLESNRFGTDEFLRWCERVGAEPYINLNLGTGTLLEALRWIDYCCGAEDTADVLQRKQNGRSAPYRVPVWGVGNETWGDHEAGALDAKDYANRLANWARFIKQNRPDTMIAAVGSSAGDDPEWDRVVLETAGSRIDYLTNHVYGHSLDRRSGAEYLNVAFSPTYVEARLRAMADLLAYADAPIKLALDEWNIRHYAADDDGRHRLVRTSPRNVQDAIFAAGVFNAMIRLSPTVAMANYVFLSNGHGCLMVRGDDVVKTTLYYVFKQYREWLRGVAVDVDVRSPGIPTPMPMTGAPNNRPNLAGMPARSNYLDVAAALDGEQLAVSLVNRHPDTSIDTRIAGAGRLLESWTLTHDDIYATNDFGAPNRVLPTTVPLTEGTEALRCPPHSVTLVRSSLR